VTRIIWELPAQVQSTTGMRLEPGGTYEVADEIARIWIEQGAARAELQAKPKPAKKEE